ncbi:MAG: response regulator transcription factor, partial [Pseudomonadota bacterium]
EKQNILQTISYGAVGFISKASSIDEIATSIESIFAGNVCLPSDILRQPEAVKRKSNDTQISPEKIRSLTRKELAVLKYLTQGLANKVIAYELNISETTVKSHVSSILRKVGATSRVQVVAGTGNINLDQYAFSGR